MVQAFLKKWCVESDFKAPNLPLSLRFKVSGYHYNSIYNNTWTKQVKQLKIPKGKQNPYIEVEQTTQYIPENSELKQINKADREPCVIILLTQPTHLNIYLTVNLWSLHICCLQKIRAVQTLAVIMESVSWMDTGDTNVNVSVVTSGVDVKVSLVF